MLELTRQGEAHPIREAKFSVAKVSSMFMCPPSLTLGDLVETFESGEKKRRAILGRISDQRETTNVEVIEDAISECIGCLTRP